MKISEATPNQYIVFIQMAIGHQKIGRRILEHLRKKDIREPRTKDSRRAAKEAACQIKAEVTTEAPTHSNLRTACTMAVKRTTTPKNIPSSLSQKEKWSKIPKALAANHTSRSQQHCAMGSSPPVIFSILSFTFSTATLSTPMPSLWHTTNPTITP
jgi:hypothetical protein